MIFLLEYHARNKAHSFQMHSVYKDILVTLYTLFPFSPHSNLVRCHPYLIDEKISVHRSWINYSSLQSQCETERVRTSCLRYLWVFYNIELHGHRTGHRDGLTQDSHYSGVQELGKVSPRKWLSVCSELWKKNVHRWRARWKVLGSGNSMCNSNSVYSGLEVANLLVNLSCWVTATHWAWVSSLTLENEQRKRSRRTEMKLPVYSWDHFGAKLVHLLRLDYYLGWADRLSETSKFSTFI